MKKVAILYDFDKTLCDKDMQEYSLIPTLGYDDPNLFWKKVGELSVEHQMDKISAYLYLLQKEFADQGTPLRKEDFLPSGKKINLYPGVDTWFDRINKIGRDLGLEVEHYVISSGMSEIIETVDIANKFKKIYACKYFYDEEGIAKWPAVIVNYTTKTQYIFRINKQVLDEHNDKDLNTWIKPSERPIPFKRMIYIADGLTDIPCMRLVREYDGRSIAVYNPDDKGPSKEAVQLVKEKRADFMSKADYRENKDMEKLVKQILITMANVSKLEDLEGKIQ